MKITPTRFQTILRRYHELHMLANQYICETETNSWLYKPIRFDEYGNIESEINTSCHCHPEYEWKMIKTKEEFAEWLDKQQ